MALNVMLVDDNPTFLAAVRQFLDMLPGVDILGQANDGKSALAMLRQNRVDVMLLDIAMPGMNGLELARAIAPLPTPPQMVFLSMHDNDAYRAAAEELGAGFVSKADFVAELLPMLELMVDAKNQQDAVSAAGADQPGQEGLTVLIRHGLRAIADRLQAGVIDATDAGVAGSREVGGLSNQPLAVLLVAHNDREAAQVLLALRRGGFDVRHQRVSTADALRAALAERVWHVVVAEFRMPDWDGLEALRIVQSADQEPPVILVCGPVGEDAAVLALKQGASDCISRAQVPSRLASAVRHELQHAALRSAQRRSIDADTDAADRTMASRNETPPDSDAGAQHALFDRAPIASVMMLPFSAITRVNDRLLELTGYSRDELVGHTVKELGLVVPDASSARLHAELDDRARVDGLELQLRCKDGSQRPVQISSIVIDVDGVEQHLHALVDLSEQQSAISQARLVRQALATISQGVLICDEKGLTLSANRAFESMTGYSQREMLGRQCFVLRGAATNAVTLVAIERAIADSQAFSGDVLSYRKDGSTFWNEVSINPVRDPQGRTTHFVTVHRDVNAHRLQQNQVKLAAQLFAQSREGAAVTNARNEIVMVNRAFREITGYDASEVIGKDPHALGSVARDDSTYELIWKSIRESGRWQGETVGRRKDGSQYPERLSISVIRDENGEVCNYVRTFSDLSDQQAASERITWLSQFDALTGLPNRSLLADRCVHDISLAERDAKPVAMMVLGIDHFKTINDTLGTTAGDSLLREFAARLSMAVREQDTVARVGGDEFVLVLPGDAPDGSGQLAERLLEMVAQPFRINDADVAISASIGIAIYPPDGLDFETLFKSAQVAMNEAKARGRGKYRFFNAEMFQNTLELATLGAELRNAIALDQLHLHYQPFVDLQSGQIGGMEALLRWNHPTLGAVPPGRFIPVAERLGLIVSIGSWVLHQACRDMRQWQDQGVQVPPVSVNLSPMQFRDPALAQHIEAILAQHAIDPGQISLELTEGAVMDDVTHSESQMRALKTLGVRLSLDDFGTGYSSLSYLKQFPFDKVKIDQSFVRDINKSSQDAVIAKVVISMAHGLGLRVIAEGVETELQCEFMRSNVCDEIQGYFFSRPIPAPDMLALLREDRRLPAHLVRVQAKPRTVLLVDDEPNVISALKRLLRPDGYQILTAGSGAEGLEQLARNPVDIIISDQRMPGMSGVQFLRQAKTLHPQTIRIVLSGHTELQSVTDAINEGAVYRFLTKPWDDAQLREFIQQAFQHKELADENEQLNLKIRTANQELATSNRQLQEVLDQKQRALARGERSLGVYREALQYIPLAVLATDDERVVAFANEQARALFTDEGPLVGYPLASMLPQLDTLVRSASSGAAAYTSVRQRDYRVKWNAMGADSSSVGTIITLMPHDIWEDT